MLTYVIAFSGSVLALAACGILTVTFREMALNRLQLQAHQRNTDQRIARFHKESMSRA